MSCPKGLEALLQPELHFRTYITIAYVTGTQEVLMNWKELESSIKSGHRSSGEGEDYRQKCHLLPLLHTGNNIPLRHNTTATIPTTKREYHSVPRVRH